MLLGIAMSNKEPLSKLSGSDSLGGEVSLSSSSFLKE